MAAIDGVSESAGRAPVPSKASALAFFGKPDVRFLQRDGPRNGAGRAGTVTLVLSVVAIVLMILFL